MTEAKPSLKERAIHEAKSFAVIFLYVWTIIGLFALQKALVLHRPPLSGQLFALLKAFVLAKFILTLELLRAGEIYREKAPVYRLVFKAIMYGIILMALSVLEEVVRGWFHGKTFEESLAEIDAGRLEGFLVLTVITAVALVPYLACKEIGQVIGHQKLGGMIFSDPPAAGKVSSPPEA